MKKIDNNLRAFIALLRAGLWEEDVRILPFGVIDYSVLFKLAEEQSVVGLIAAGLEHVTDTQVPKEDALIFVGHILQLEQRNTSMNHFIEVLVDKMRTAGIYSLLVKGQGIAQCYERPLWRECGDVDLFLSKENYINAKDFLRPLVNVIFEENEKRKHLAMKIEPWVVELHGSLSGGLSKRIDKSLENVQLDIWHGGNVRSWIDGKTQVFLPGIDNDIIIVFTHILQHFFCEGIGLRQICDWCRLLWTYADSVNVKLLETRLQEAGMMTEWKAFAELAVNELGMPKEAMPFYSDKEVWKRKSKRILSLILDTGNFGHNRDTSYQQNEHLLKRKVTTFFRNTKDANRRFLIFPLDSVKIWSGLMSKRFLTTILGK